MYKGMKQKKLLLALAMVLPLSVWGTTESAIVSASAGSLTAGTTLASSTSVTMSAAFDDTYNVHSFTRNFSFNGTKYTFNAFSQGSTNPSTSTESTTAPSDGNPPIKGAAYKFRSTQAGYIYAIVEFKYNKKFFVFDGSSIIDCSYSFMDVGNGTTYDYSFTASSDATNNLSALVSGLSNRTYYGIIKFQVDANKDYLLTMTGGKISCSGFFFDTDGTTVFRPYSIVLDETATSLTAATNEDVLVKRTIPANKWCTSCLPFYMTEGNVIASFGSDVELAEFTGCTSEKSGSDVTGINVNFSAPATRHIDANHPYLIKVSSDISQFAMGNVSYDNYAAIVDVSGNKFIGTSVSTTVPSKSLFLSGGDYYYSTGSSTMKAFRGYFTFTDVLSSYSDGGAGARIHMSITDSNGETTNIDLPCINPISESKGIYSLNGIYKGKSENRDALPKGVYVVNGKKTIIK